MPDRELAEKLLKDHFTATAALIALMLKNLPDDVRTRELDAVRNGTGKVELRTRVESNETELVRVPTDGSEADRSSDRSLYVPQRPDERRTQSGSSLAPNNHAEVASHPTATRRRIRRGGRRHIGMRIGMHGRSRHHIGDGGR